MPKITIDNVRKLFEERGCVLLSTEYKSAKTHLDFICTCGRTSKISYDKFRQGQLCRGFRGVRSASKTKHTYDYIHQYFSDNDCELLSVSYTGNKQKLKYRCSCGTVSEIAFAKFQAGQRCYTCKSRKIRERFSGSNHPFWRSDLTEADRIKERNIPGYDDWRRTVMARDNYTCVCCGIRGDKLHVHHIESYARVPELRIDITNGVTLCVACHMEYHSKVQHNDADTESFVYFMGEYRNPWYAGEILV